MLFFLLLASVYALDCCVYVDDTGLCNDACPTYCVWQFDECPMVDGCLFYSRGDAPQCTEPEGCLCSTMYTASLLNGHAPNRWGSLKVPKKFPKQ